MQGRKERGRQEKNALGESQELGTSKESEVGSGEDGGLLVRSTVDDSAVLAVAELRREHVDRRRREGKGVQPSFALVRSSILRSSGWEVGEDIP
jgi:hypothetical protein